jgi:plastocyanin
MKLLNVAAVTAFVAGGAVALAAETTITQKGKQFSEKEVAIKKGDTVLFVNDDNIAHNVMSTTSGNAFNLGSQPPGKATPVTFDKLGTIQVLCAIHPTMRMTVKVSD